MHSHYIQPFISSPIHLPTETLNPSTPLMLHKWLNARAGRDRERERREEEWRCVFVPGPNGASNAMNRLFGRFTVDSSGSKWVGGCVTWNAFHWQGISQLCLTGRCRSCQHARFASPPQNLTCMICITIIGPPVFLGTSLYFLFPFFPGQHTLISFSFCCRSTYSS